MVLFLLLLSLLSSSVYANQECTTINITDSWDYPMNWPPFNLAWCLIFDFSPDSYAQMNVTTGGMDSIDSITIGYAGQFQRGSIILKDPDTSLAASFAVPFYVNVSNGGLAGSRMMIAIHIKLFSNNFGKKVQQTFTTGLNNPPGLLYFEDLQEGATYNFHADSQMGYLQVTFPWGGSPRDRDLWNIFVYVDGEFKFSTYDVYNGNYPNPINGSVSLYVAPRFWPKNTIGALLFSDNSNFKEIYNTTVAYVPVDQTSLTRTYLLPVPDQGLDTALTIIGDKNGSTPFDVRTFTTSGNDAFIIYLAGGVVQDHQGGSRLQQNQLPLRVTGNLNTFYVTKGSASIKITVSP